MYRLSIIILIVLIGCSGHTGHKPLNRSEHRSLSLLNHPRLKFLISHYRLRKEARYGKLSRATLQSSAEYWMGEANKEQYMIDYLTGRADAEEMLKRDLRLDEIHRTLQALVDARNRIDHAYVELKGRLKPRPSL